MFCQCPVGIVVSQTMYYTYERFPFIFFSLFNLFSVKHSKQSISFQLNHAPMEQNRSRKLPLSGVKYRLACTLHSISARSASRLDPSVEKEDLSPSN